MSELPEKINDIYKEFEQNMDNEDVRRELFRINDYAQTIDNGAFLIVIIGAVKAGKSTFCNLLAGEDVCQTDHAACTTRPMFITKGNNIYRTFKSTSNLVEDNVFVFEKILSNIIKKDEDKEIAGVESQKMPITKECIVDANDKNRDYFLTSFSVEGSELVRDKIVFVDMPGLDDANSSFNEYQKAILSRADYVIFIQKSTGDINTKDVEVFNYIHKCNSGVMTSVLMNWIDQASFDENDTSFKDATEKLSKIENRPIISQFKNFQRELSAVINFGLVKSYKWNTITENRKKDGEKEYNTLKQLINSIITIIINRAVEIRKANIANNIYNRVSALSETINKIIGKREEKISLYNDFEQKAKYLFDSDKIQVKIVDNDSRQWMLQDDSYIKDSTPKLYRKMYDHKEMKHKVEEYLNKVKQQLNQEIEKTIEDAERKTKDALNDKIISLNYEIKKEIELETSIKAAPFEFKDNEAINLYVEEYFPTVSVILDKPKWYQWILHVRKGGMVHSKEDCLEIFDNACEPIKDSISMINTELDSLLKKRIKEYKKQIYGNIINDISEKCSTKKDDIIKDYKDYCDKTEQLKRLSKKLSQL